jgi:hypothetical protein
MTSAAMSVLALGLYMLVQGSILLVIPNVLLEFIGLPSSNAVWVRVVGLMLMILGFYYSQAAKANLTEFFRWTIPIRIAQFFAFLAFVLLSFVKPVILLFAGLELLSGVWT